METGVDKLEFTTRDFRVHRVENSGLWIRPCMQELGKEKQPDPFVLVDKFGGRESGEKAILNDPLFNLTINKHGMRLTFNPSKPYHPHHLVSDDKTLFERVETVVTKLDHQHGIIFDLNGSKLTRVDTAKDALLENPVSTYQPVFSSLRMPRSTRHNQFSEGYQTGNNSRTCIFYNKGLERRDENPEIFSLYGNKLMRSEQQFKKQGISTYLGLNVFEDLKNFGIQHLKDKFSHTMSKDIFKLQTLGDTAYIPFDVSVETVRFLREKYPKGWKQKAVALLGGGDFFSSPGSVDHFINIVKEVVGPGNRVTPKEMRAEIEELQFIRTRTIKNSFGSLYEELKRKFVA
jgi:hypothetical protein